MIGIYADKIRLIFKGMGTILGWLEFITCKIRPAPNACIYNMREAFPAGYLQSAIECSLYGDTGCGNGASSGDSGN